MQNIEFYGGILNKNLQQSFMKSKYQDNKKSWAFNI